MLRSFRVANHRSFRDEAELLLLPAYDKSRPVVPIAGVFGANASGKSNLLDALSWMQAAVRESYAQWEPGAGIPRTPFRLDAAAATAPSVYCVELVLGEGRYTYGMEVDDKNVIEEWLYTYPHNRRRVIFERQADRLRLGSTVPDYRVRGEQLARQTRENALFLSVAAHNDLTEVRAVYEWFRTGLRFADGGEVSGEELFKRLDDEQQRPALVELIGAADLGIRDITGEEEETSAIVRTAARDALGSRVLREKLDELADEPLVQLLFRYQDDRAVRERFLDRLYKQIEDHVSSHPGQLRFHHGRSKVPLALEDQSAGTRNWIGLVSAAFDAISATGLMIVDEVDASLHPHLTARLINLFRDADTNPDGAQLLFTTHDPTLLDEDTLARDEIWFVEKEPDSGATRIFPLTDFHPRKNEDTEGRYLAGGYGAVPVLSDRQFRRAVRAGRTRDAAA